ncbi:MAG: hypothetical protein JSV12_05555 [Candidatus Bathyarchaeota archaeon]|nr:MAG: hypothetical protein JSV12_05555 [Candidatus Bathyarchaeota archaeon]
MKGRTVFLLMILMLACIGVALTNIVPVMASERTLGVKVGDWFKYEFNVTWSSDKCCANPPQFDGAEDEVEWVQFEVVSISGTNVTFERTFHFKNGTDSHKAYWVDIDSEGGFKGIFFAANLSEGDRVYLADDYALVNRTFLHDYGGSIREINYANYFRPITDAIYIPYTSNASASWDIYLDRQIGVLTEKWEYVVGQIEGGAFYYNTTFSLKIIDSSYPEIIPEVPSFLVLPLFMITTLLAVIVYRRKHSM